MAIFKLQDKIFHTLHDLPPIGEFAPFFSATKSDLSTVTLKDYQGQALLINVYPSLDTAVCFRSVQTCQKMNSSDYKTLCISMDLPFALKRAEHDDQFNNVILLSDFRNREFGDLYGLTIVDGPLAGLLARAVIILDKDHRILHHELVENISDLPDFDKISSNMKSCGLSA